MKKIIFIVGIIIIFGVMPLHAATWYVDNAATGANNGSSWSNAWTGFSTINWAAIQPGDTIYISGGSSSKTYNETLSIGASGSAGAHITVSAGQDNGHNGLVIIDKNWSNYYGISISSKSYVTISGQVGTEGAPHIKVTRSTFSGIQIDGNSHDFNVGYVEVTECGNQPNVFGVNIVVQQHNSLGELHHCIIHNNHDDELHALVAAKSPGTQYGSLRIHHNDIYDFHMDAVKISLAGVDFYNNTVHDRGVYRGDHPDGIQAWGSYFRVYNNHFYNFVRSDDNLGNSYIRYNPDSTIDENPNNVLIFNNLFTEVNVPPAGSVFRGIELAFGDPSMVSARNIYFVNNTIKGTPLFGLFCGFKATMGSADVSNIIIENNIFMDATRTGYGSAAMIFDKGNGSISYGSHGSGAIVTVDYNAVSASSSTFKPDVALHGTIYTYTNFKNSSGCQAHDVAQSPQLSPSLRPLATSPVIGAGVNRADLFLTDKSGTPRQFTGAWSIGAYEYRVSTMSAPQGLMVRPPN